MSIRLPDESLFPILDALSARELCTSASRVDRQWHRVALDDALWRRRCKLARIKDTHRIKSHVLCMHKEAKEDCRLRDVFFVYESWRSLWRHPVQVVSGDRMHTMAVSTVHLYQKGLSLLSGSLDGTVGHWEYNRQQGRVTCQLTYSSQSSEYFSSLFCCVE
jgi:hypothetical protein